MVETGDSVRDGAGESVGIGEGSGGELMLLEVTPASLDVIQFGGIFRQPFEGEPRVRGERLCCQLAGVDRPVVENRDQGSGSWACRKVFSRTIFKGVSLCRTCIGTTVDRNTGVWKPDP